MPDVDLCLRFSFDPDPWLGASAMLRHLVQTEHRRRMARAEFAARAVTRESLRPRLRWIGLRPRGLRLLKRAGLWTPPSMLWRDGHLVGVQRLK